MSPMKNNILMGILVSVVYTMSNITYAQDCDLADNAEYGDDLSYLCNEPEDTVAEYPEYPKEGQSENYPFTDGFIPNTIDSSTSSPIDPSPDVQTPPSGSSTDKPNISGKSKTDKPDKPATITANKIEKQESVKDTKNNSSNEDEVVHWVTSHSGVVIIIYLKANPNYASGKTLTFTVYPRQGQVKDNKNDTLGYTPNEGFAGEDSFTYALTDAQGNQSATTVRIVVNKMGSNKNDSNLEKVNFSDKAEHKLEINHGEWTVIDISANYEPNGQQKLTLNPSENSQVINNQNGTLTYIPNKDFSGIDRFTYTVTHVGGKTYTFIVIIKVGILSYTYQAIEKSVVTPIYSSNSADHFVTTTFRSVAIIDIRKHYKPSRYIKLVLDISFNGQTFNGQIVDNGDGTLIYIPEVGFVGIDSFTYTVIDKKKKTSVTFKVEIEVRKENHIQPMKCNTMYVVHDEGVKDSQIFTVDPDAHTAVKLGPMYYGLDLEGMAIDPTKQRLYAVSGIGGPKNQSHFDGYLYLVNPQTGALKFIGDTGFRELTALAFHPDGTLWAWSVSGAKNQKKGKGGIIQINPETAQSDLLFPSTLSSKRKVEGLAWSTDGTMLYGSENTNLWRFDGKKFKRICDNFPAEIEALETLYDGMLMFAADNDKGNTVFVYDPKHCKIILNRSFTTNMHYEDLESIAWPLKCQAPSNISNWDAKFNGSNETECSNKPQWLTMTGTVTLEPLESQAYIETYWQLVSPKSASCPPSQVDNIGYPIENEDCKEVFYQSQFITGGETKFSIKGWWPGILKDAEKDRLVKTSYGINIYDMDRNLLDEISKTVSGKPSVCAKATAKNTKVNKKAKDKETKATKAKNTKVNKKAKDKKTKATKAKNTKVDKAKDKKTKATKAKNTKVDKAKDKETQSTKAKNAKVDKTKDKETQSAKAKNAKVDKAKDKETQSAKAKNAKDANQNEKDAEPKNGSKKGKDSSD
jgi:hypothetical protein